MTNRFATKVSPVNGLWGPAVSYRIGGPRCSPHSLVRLLTGCEGRAAPRFLGASRATGSNLVSASTMLWMSLIAVLILLGTSGLTKPALADSNHRAVNERGGSSRRYSRPNPPAAGVVLSSAHSRTPCAQSVGSS